MSEPADFYAKRLVDATPPIPESRGASGYFSRPASGLDPRLFNGHGQVYELVRQQILGTLYRHWTPLYTGAQDWSTVWIAGSGASHQFAADRGDGDLDILIGVDWERFFADNPAFANLTPQEAADLVNAELKAHLWPKTSRTLISGYPFEMTFYINPLGEHIEDIGAYAAYNLTADRWDIEPPDLPQDPRTLFTDTDWQAADEDRRTAAALRDATDRALAAARRSRPGTPAWADAISELRRTASRAAAFFDDIHLGRHAAFAPGGRGFLDPANFRWQSAKLSGVAQELAQIKRLDVELTATQRPDTPHVDVLVYRALHHLDVS